MLSSHLCRPTSRTNSPAGSQSAIASELLALEWLRVAGASVFDNDPRLLHVSDAEALGRQRRDQCGVLGKFLTPVAQRAPTWLQTAVAYLISRGAPVKNVRGHTPDFA